METQDHTKPKQPGNEGHSGGGAHVCHKCGWPFPNPHPSAKHRRAHKKVCGTVEGYRLDNDAQDKTHLIIDGSDGEHGSDDENNKNPSDKVVERTISRRTSSGVGSRSSRSTRSEDEVFTDAVTDFTDSPGPVEASEGVIQRFYSMKPVTESDIDDIEHAAENGSTDNLSTTSLILKDNQSHVETVQNLKGGNDKVEADSLYQDQISSSTTNTTPVPASVTVQNEKADGSIEIVSSKEMSELRMSCNETTDKASEDVSVLTTDEFFLGPVSAGEIAKPIGLESTGAENNVECSQDFCALKHSVEVIDPSNGSTSKSSGVMVGHGSKTGANEDVDNLAAPDALHSHQNSEIVEDSDRNRRKINAYEAPGSVTETESVDYDIALGAEVCSGDSVKVCSEDDFLIGVGSIANKQDAVADQNFGESRQIPDVVASDGDISRVRSEVITDAKTEILEDKKLSFAEEIVPLESVSPEGAIAENPKFTSNGSANTSNIEHVMLQEIDEREVLGKEMSGTSSSADCAIYGNQDCVVVQTQSEGNEMKSGGEYNESVNAEIALGLSMVGSHGVISEPLASEIHNPGKSDIMVDPGEVMGSLPLVECVGEEGPGGISETHNPPVSISKISSSDALEVSEDAQCLQSSSAFDDPATMRLAEEASGVVEGDRIIKQHVAVSAVDVAPDSSSQSDSLEGNWGSVSVMSALSDTPPAIGTLASNHSQASAAEENVSLEPKLVIESQHSGSKTSTEPHAGFSKTEGISEIQTSEEQQRQGSALQTALSSSVACVEKAPHGGKRNEEIIAKVNNWSTEKQHTPLKTLLGEATARSRAESPIHHSQSLTPVPQEDGIPTANNGFSKTENVILSFDNPTAESSKEETGKEWNSPARYPVNIKTEKRRTKGRAYWAPFLCCSSVNAR